MNKTAEVIYRIVENNSTASITVIMKLLYLIDLIHLKKNGKKLTDLNYKRYFYGPFSSEVYTIVDDLIRQDLLNTEARFTRDTDYFVYKIANAPKGNTNLTEEEIDFLNKTLKEFEGLSAKFLTEVTYHTKPMKELGATIGGNEEFETELNLSLVLDDHREEN